MRIEERMSRDTGGGRDDRPPGASRARRLCASLVLLASIVAGTTAAGPLLSLGARWDELGHRTVAAIAYERLTPATRARVDSLLRQHPDYATLSRGGPAGAADLAAEVFMRASVWPDVLRGDPRFYNEASANPVPTPALPGFPDMQRHAGWHYLNEPFSTDGTPTVETAVPNALTQLIRLTELLGDPAQPAPARAYHLSWVMHLVGDVHQPLHAVARFSRPLPSGDAGGNRTIVQVGDAPGDSMNLHSYWDGLLGRPYRGTPAPELARRLIDETRPVANSESRVDDGPGLALTVRGWIQESATLARYVVYSMGDRTASGAPPRATREYGALAESIARRRVTLAGYRLANLIESRLR